MFVTVKFGDDQSEIFNANCRNQVLLMNIKERCHCDNEDTVELSDEQGIVKDLHKNPQEYGVKYMKDRENLILLKVDRTTEDDDISYYVPLLVCKATDKDFIAKINPKPVSKPSRNRHHNAPSEDYDGKTSRSTSRRNSIVIARRSSLSARRGSRATLLNKK